MKSLHERIVREVLPRVQAPAQYVGGEWNAVVKDRRSVEVAVCLAFPDTYAIGMSQSGLHILYGTLNARPDVAAERCFAPWPDMADLLREKGLPMYSLETFTPLADFDVLGFSLQYEMGYSNVLLMLELSHVPVRRTDRSAEHPLVIGGGPAAFNPEPLSDFIDIFAPGDGEELVHRFVDAYREVRTAAGSREDLCRGIVARVPGIYAPGLYSDGYPRRPRFAGVPSVVQASVAQDLERAFYPEAPIVPYHEIVHDRITLEIMRGCARGCRFCQAGMTRRPVRRRSVERLREVARRSYAATGHSEISLASLSSSDYPGMERLARGLSSEFDGRCVGLSMPSLRVNDQLRKVPGLVSTVRKSGLTIAPEAGTERLRRVINKDVTDQDLFAGVEAAFAEGWQRVKLYFMVGLPTETDEDIDAIVHVAEEVARRRSRKGRGPAQVGLNVATFVPKPHTPFQWASMIGIERMMEIRRRLLARIRMRSVKLSFHRPDRSYLEGVFSRGDSRLGRVLEEARRLGCRFDAWDETFRFDAWTAAFEAAGVAPDDYALRPRALDEPLPWDHISVGVSREYLLREWDRACRGETTPYCLDGRCQGCGLPVCADRDQGKAVSG